MLEGTSTSPNPDWTARRLRKLGPLESRHAELTATLPLLHQELSDLSLRLPPLQHRKAELISSVEGLRTSAQKLQEEEDKYQAGVNQRSDNALGLDFELQEAILRKDRTERELKELRRDPALRDYLLDLEAPIDSGPSPGGTESLPLPPPPSTSEIRSEATALNFPAPASAALPASVVVPASVPEPAPASAALPASVVVPASVPEPTPTSATPPVPAVVPASVVEPATSVADTPLAATPISLPEVASASVASLPPLALSVPTAGPSHVKPDIPSALPSLSLALTTPALVPGPAVASAASTTAPAPSVPESSAPSVASTSAAGRLAALAQTSPGPTGLSEADRALLEALLSKVLHKD